MSCFGLILGARPSSAGDPKNLTPGQMSMRVKIKMVGAGCGYVENKLPVGQAELCEDVEDDIVPACCGAVGR